MLQSFVHSFQPHEMGHDISAAGWEMQALHCVSSICSKDYLLAKIVQI